MNHETRIINLSHFIKLLSTTILFLPIFLFSCITQRDLEYIQDKTEPQQSYNEAGFSDYQIKSSDALYIKINSLDDPTSNIFNQPSVQQQMLDPYGAYMNSYSVDNEGYIVLPVIERIFVLGKTTEQVSQLIKDSVANILSHPMVTVRLVNRYVTVLGEVRNQGHFVFSQDKFTIFNAIGLAGDITEYGNREEVMLTRNENGNNITVRLDLTDADILSSPYYFIQPNDMIYVSPMRKRYWGMREFPFSIILSAISTALLVYSFVQSQ